MKILYLNELNNITSKILEGFIKVNFLYQHIKDVRMDKSINLSKNTIKNETVK